jgi:hypothetical protein
LHVWYHVGLFAVLALLAIYISRRMSTRLVWLLAFLLLGPGMEYAEAARFNAAIEWNDVATDTVGVVLGGLAGWLFTRRSRKTP